MVVKGLVKGEWGVSGSQAQSFSLEDEKILNGGDGCTTMQTYLMPLNSILKNVLNLAFSVFTILSKEKN